MNSLDIQVFSMMVIHYLGRIWTEVTDFFWWKAFIGGLLTATVGADNMELFSVLLIVSFVDFLLVFFGYLIKKPQGFRTKKVLNWGIKIAVYWLIITAFNYISKNIDFAQYLTNTILYVYIFTEALSILRNDVYFKYTRAKYPIWLLERLEEHVQKKPKK